MSDEAFVEEIFLKPGQKFATPSPGNGDRVFYETLLQQRPDSEMAQEWCLFYGILDEKEAQKLYLTYCKRKNLTPKVHNNNSNSNSNSSPSKKPVVVVKKQQQKKASSASSSYYGEDADLGGNNLGVSESKTWESASAPL